MYQHEKVLLKYPGSRLISERERVIKLLTDDGWNYSNLSENLAADKELLVIAMKTFPASVIFATKTLSNDDDIKKLIQFSDDLQYKHHCDELLLKLRLKSVNHTKFDILQQLKEKRDWVFAYLSNDFISIDLIKEALSINWSFIQYISTTHPNYEEISLLAVKKSLLCLSFIQNPSQKVIFSAIKINPEAIFLLPADTLINNKVILLYAAALGGDRVARITDFCDDLDIINVLSIKDIEDRVIKCHELISAIGRLTKPQPNDKPAISMLPILNRKYGIKRRESVDDCCITKDKYRKKDSSESSNSPRHEKQKKGYKKRFFSLKISPRNKKGVKSKLTSKKSNYSSTNSPRALQDKIQNKRVRFNFNSSVNSYSSYSSESPRSDIENDVSVVSVDDREKNENLKHSTKKIPATAFSYTNPM
jgi:hypothetical protein